MISIKMLILSGVLIAVAASSHAGEKPGSHASTVPEGYQVRETVRSPDSRKAAYILLKKDEKTGKDKSYVFFDGVLSKSYDAVNKLVLSPDGKRFVYCARKGEKEHFVLDGKESKPYDTV
jgi:hypothetical protein